MIPESFDTSLLEVGFLVAKILLFICLLAIVLGILTLPIFLMVLSIIQIWYWSQDTSSSEPMVGQQWSRLRRGFAILFKIIFPVLSFSACGLLSWYIGIWDFLGDQTQKQNLPSKKFEQIFESITRQIAEKAIPPLPEPTTNETANDAKKVSKRLESLGPTLAEEAEEERNSKIKQMVGMLRSFAIFFILLVGPFPSAMIVLSWLFGRKGMTLIQRSLSRNLLRTCLTYLAIFVLSFVISAIWSMLGFLDAVTTERESNLKAIITERSQIPSQMPPKNESDLIRLIEELGKKNNQTYLVNGEKDIMTWGFVGGDTRPAESHVPKFFILLCHATFQSINDARWSG